MRLTLLLALVCACSHDGLTVNDDLGATFDLAVTTGCMGPVPQCAHGCGSDWWDQAVCNGQWVCPPGTIDVRTCPPGTCWGPPQPGEVCGPGGWECRPEVTGAYALCPDFMCPECTGFVGPTESLGCYCECKGTEVRCTRHFDLGQ